MIQDKLSVDLIAYLGFRWLSIGRLYKDQDLAKLVDLILIAYTKQPVDFVMHHFDVLQVS